MVRISIGNKITQALCDSGAQITCINEHFLKSTDFRNSALGKSIVKSIIGAGGTIYKVKGQIKLPIKFKEIIIYQDFQVITELRNLPRVKTTRYGLNLLKYFAAKTWNDLPDHFRKESSFPQFKNLINSWNGRSCHCSACS